MKICPPLYTVGFLYKWDCVIWHCMLGNLSLLHRWIYIWETEKGNTHLQTWFLITGMSVSRMYPGRKTAKKKITQECFYDRSVFPVWVQYEFMYFDKTKKVFCIFFYIWNILEESNPQSHQLFDITTRIKKPNQPLCQQRHLNHFSVNTITTTF